MVQTLTNRKGGKRKLEKEKIKRVKEIKLLKENPKNI